MLILVLVSEMVACFGLICVGQELFNFDVGGAGQGGYVWLNGGRN